jgi:acetoacetate decarboxylase
MKYRKAYRLLNDRSWRIALKKSFWGDDQNFLGSLMRKKLGQPTLRTEIDTLIGTLDYGVRRASITRHPALQP